MENYLKAVRDVKIITIIRIKLLFRFFFFPRHKRTFRTTAKSLQLCPTLCDPIDGSPPGSPVPGILQARTLEWVAISFSNAWKWKVKSEREVAQSCPSPGEPMDDSPLGFSIHGILQARALEWGAIAFSPELPSPIQFHRWGKQSEGPSDLATVLELVRPGSGPRNFCRPPTHDLQAP